MIDSQGFIPMMTPAQALKLIQVMADHSHNWYDGAATRQGSNDSSDDIDMQKLNENIHASQVSCKICEGTQLTQECPIRNEGKIGNQVKYIGFLKEIVNQFCEESIKEQTAIDEWIRKYRENTDLNLKKLDALTKNLEVKVEILTQAVLTNEGNTVKKVKENIEKDREVKMESVPRDLPIVNPISKEELKLLIAKDTQSSLTKMKAHSCIVNTYEKSEPFINTQQLNPLQEESQSSRSSTIPSPISNKQDENPIRAHGDYFKPSHEGYRNTTELPEGNNVVPLRSDIIRDFAKPVKAISLPHDVPSTFDYRLIELENQVQRLMKAHLDPKQPIQVKKITSSYEICSGPRDTQYSMENPEQAFVKYASSRNNEDKPNFNWDRTQSFTSPQKASLSTYSSSYQTKLERTLSEFYSHQERRLSSVGFKGLHGISTAQLVLLVYKVTVVFNKVNAAKSRVTTTVRVSTAGWIKWLEDQDTRVNEIY
nr:lon protease 2, peroxisomal [Tanacetum cinerariifolium]